MAPRIAALTLWTVLLGAVPAAAKDPAPAKAEASPQAKEETLTLKVGGKHTLKVPALTRVALGDPSVVDVETEGAEAVVLSALKPGETTLLVWGEGGARRTWRIVVKR
ncbi:pilus assembly protein N-terminal domain-containing protein [Corallococcus llansteffanensis]|uniref:pilus assembly protein N-terminal domain-containing protein n=1 Tax=Corallococcus llansteffanensis TaxID=2316731 RepID=UPI00131522E7|nr:pilus assembly protein N-terminal domain-containing protein [Corallococcus llansteffanensis]